MNRVLTKRWAEASFGELVSHSAFGPRFSGNDYAADGNIATLRTTDLDDHGRISYETMPLARLDEARFENHFLKKGDLVITRSGTCGIGAVFEGFSLPVLPGAFLIRFRLNDRADPRFFRYFFNSPAGRMKILSVARGAVQQNLNITNVEGLRVPVPPVPEQKCISDVLSNYDDLIENIRRRIQLLEQAARLLYREWFVHLRFPGHEHVKIKDGVPEEWGKRPLGDLARLNYGRALKEDNRIQGDYPVYGSSGVVGNHEKPLVAGPGIIVGRKGNVGSVYWSETDFFPIDTVYFIGPEQSSLYLYYALAHTQFISTDVAVPGLNRDFAHSRKLLAPPPKLKTAFEETVVPIHKQIQGLRRYNSCLVRARDLLLPPLMNGEIAA